MIIQSTFTPPRWLRNPHVQTIWPLLFRAKNTLTYDKQRLELPDGDFVDIFWCEPQNSSSTSSHIPSHLPSDKKSQPIVIVSHGMGGCFESHYIPGLIKSLLRENYRIAFLHARGCSGEPNRLPVSFHAADTSELNHLVACIKTQYPEAPLAAVGFSLGGSVLLKWLAETSSQQLLNAATALSVPFELSATAETLNQGFSLIYQSYLLKRLKYLAIEKSHFHPAPLSISKIKSVKSLRDYDDKMTAKINGFGDVDTYYRIASCRQYLADIQTPTLIINAVDDPFVPQHSLPTDHELGSGVTLELSALGGHVGFLQSAFQDKRFFYQRVPQYLRSYLVVK